MAAAIDMGLEVDAIGIELSHFREAEDLEAAGVRKISPVPTSEFVEAAGCTKKVRAESHVEVIRVCENDCGV